MKVIAGKDKGKTGKVLRVLPRADRVVVEGIAVAKRHKRGTEGQTGRIVERPMPIHHSNVMVVDPDTEKPTRIRIVRKDGERRRITVKSGSVLD